MALVPCIVDTDGGEDYTSLSNAIGGNFGATSADLAGNSEWVECECRASGGVADSTQCDFGGFTTSSEHDIVIFTNASYRHNGTFPASGNIYRMDVSSDRCLDFYSSYITFQGVAVKLTCSDDISYLSRCTTSGNVIVDRCVLEMDANSYTGHRALSWYGGGPYYIRHNIIYGASGSGSMAIRMRVGSATLGWIDNNTICKSEVGVYRSDANGTVLARNNLAFGNTDDYGSDYAFSSGSTDNAYSEGSDPGTSGVDISGYSAAQIFEDHTNNDFHLIATAPVIDEGTDLGASIPEYDIDYASRSGTWDIGADEVTEWDGTGSATLPIITVSGAASKDSGETASGSASLPVITVTASATVERSTSASVTLPSITASGAAAVERPASGTVTLPSITTGGTAAVSRDASAAVDLPSLTVSGSAVAGKVASGTVSVSVPTVSGQAAVERPVAGTTVLPSITASGAAAVTRHGTAAVTLPGLTVTAEAGIGGVESASGTAILPIPTVSGTAGISRPVSGALEVPALTVSASAFVARHATGVVTLQAVTVSGAAERIYQATGTVTLPIIAASATAGVTHPATGTVTLPAINTISTIQVGRIVTATVTLPCVAITASIAGRLYVVVKQIESDIDTVRLVAARLEQK